MKESKSAREMRITEEQVRTEHHREVNPTAHWIYMLGVLAVSFGLMLALIAILGQ